MTTIGTIKVGEIDSQPSFSTAITKTEYDMENISLKTVDINSAQSADKDNLLDYYNKLKGYLAGTTTAEDYATALAKIKDYVLTADDYTKLRDGEISVKDFLKETLQDELYSTDANSKGYYVKLGESLQAIIDSINTDLITPLNANFASGTFFPTKTIDESYFAPDVRATIDNFAAGNAVIITTFTDSITETTDLGTTAKDAAASYTKKPSVIVLSK
jgi:hypothetical protein